MEKNFMELDDQALKDAQMELYRKLEALPGTFNVYGEQFTWYSRMKTLSITGTNLRVNYHINLDGSIESYSFSSESGTNETSDTIRHYQIYLRLLSEEFRSQIIEDYRSKKPIMDAVEEDCRKIDREMERRQDEIRAAEAAEMAEQRKRYEQPGQVWCELGSVSSRYTIKSVTEKSILFTIWYYSEKENGWKADGTQRIMKSCLGRKNCKPNLFPLGTDDLIGEKPETPESKGDKVNV